MRILLIHNRYRNAGGEDAAFQAEMAMLRMHGHEVYAAVENNGSTGGMCTVSQIMNSAWSRQSYDVVTALCRKFRPDIAHVHNFWMSWTPSVHAACREAGVPTVQTLHNFRLLCANALFLREGKPCEDCLTGSPWLGVTRRCYRNSAVASAAVVRMITVNRRRRTWQDDVSAFITPGEHARSRFVAAGFPANRVFVKPNVVPDLGDAPQPPSAHRTIAFAGRLSPEKGLDVLLKAWNTARRPGGSRLVVGGRGQAAGIQQVPDVTFAGHLESSRVSELLGEVRAVVLPSLCYETFGNTVVEGFSRGRSAIVSDIGALCSLVENGRTGLKFAPGNVEELARHIETMLSSDDLADTLGESARNVYVSRYSEAANYEALVKIYDFALTDAVSREAPLE